jgi:hypothetical protein
VRKGLDVGTDLLAIRAGDFDRDGFIDDIALPRLTDHGFRSADYCAAG